MTFRQLVTLTLCLVFLLAGSIVDVWQSRKTMRQANALRDSTSELAEQLRQVNRDLDDVHARLKAMLADAGPP